MFKETASRKCTEKLLARFASLTKSWNDVENSVWLCRLFMAAKLIMMATLQVNALQFAEKVNLRVVSSHLRYYAILSLSRALCLTIPEIEWDDGLLIAMSHERTIKHAVAHVQAFDRGVAKSLNAVIRTAKAQRELIAYRAPSSGDAGLDAMAEFKPCCRLLAELAQMNSELLELSFEKHTADQQFAVLDEEVQKLWSVEIEGLLFLDEADVGRLGYLMRKHPRPTSLMMLMTDGHLDDFFGAWCEGESNENNFDPDSNLCVIFEM